MNDFRGLITPQVSDRQLRFVAMKITRLPVHLPGLYFFLVASILHRGLRMGVPLNLYLIAYGAPGSHSSANDARQGRSQRQARERVAS